MNERNEMSKAVLVVKLTGHINYILYKTIADYTS